MGRVPAPEPGQALRDAPQPLRQRGSNHVGMRQFNERVVLQAIRSHGALPKAEIARLTGLTAQTIGLITTRLEDDGLLLRQERVRGRIGQPSVPLALNPDGAFAIGIKIGRRSADWLLVDFTGHVRERTSMTYEFPRAASLLPALRQRTDALREKLGAMAPRLVGVGVAAPFQLGGWHQMLGLSATESETWNRLDLQAEVQAMTELPVSFAKDTTAACVAELVGGRGRDLPSFLYLFVDTFVGGGLVLNSHLHAGSHGNAAAMASLPMGLANESLRRGAQNGPPGQMIGHASLWELERRFQAHGLDPTAAYDERAMRTTWRKHTEAWLRHAANALAYGITSGTSVLDVDAIVIDGSMCQPLLAELLAATQKAMAGYDWQGLWQPALHQGLIGSDARALGGALLPLHALFGADRGVFIK